MFDFRYPTPLPSTKGWGPGWPNCQTDKRVPHPIFQGGVHEDILELVNLLVAHLKSKGYVFKPGWSWGGGCRATKGSTGDTPSFHSWWLGLDFNAPENPFSKSAAGTAKLNNEHRWVVGIMADYGFFWLGPAIGDWMHFSFCGSPADARAMTEKARRLLGDDPMTDEEKKQLARAVAVANGVDDYLARKAPPDGAHPQRVQTFRALEDARKRPGPGVHSHDDKYVKKGTQITL